MQNVILSSTLQICLVQIISLLDENIKTFMSLLHHNWPETIISPKLHMIEDHIVPLLLRWNVGCGFLGEQGGEFIHKRINGMKQRYSNVRNKKDRLKYIMDCQLASTNPHACSKRVHRKERNFQQKSDK